MCQIIDLRLDWNKSTKTLLFARDNIMYSKKPEQAKISLQSSVRLGDDKFPFFFLSFHKNDHIGVTTVERPDPKGLPIFSQCSEFPPHKGFKLMLRG